MGIREDVTDVVGCVIKEGHRTLKKEMGPWVLPKV